MKKIFKIIWDYFNLVFPFLWKDWRCLGSTVATFLISFVDIWLVTLGPWLFSDLIRNYEREDVIYVGGVTFCLVGCWVWSKTMRRFRNLIFFRVVNEAIRGIRFRLVTHFTQMALRGGVRYEEAEVLSMSTRVSMSIRFCLRSTFLNFIPTLFKLVSCGVVMQYAFSGSKYFLIWVLLTFVYVFWAMTRYTRIRNVMWETCDEVMVAMGDSLKQRSFAKLHPEEEERRLATFFDKEFSRCRKEYGANNSIYLVQNILFFLGAGGLLAYLVSLLREGVIDVPKLVLLKGYIFVIHKQVLSLTDYVRGSTAYIIDMKKVLEMLSLRTDEQMRGEKEGVVWKEEEAVIALKDISFSYPESGKKVIDKVSLEIHRGEKIAIVGDSGCGKSTLAQLMAGIYLPDKGEVLFKGVSTNKLTPAMIGRTLYLVGQDDSLMANSIREHLGREERVFSPLGYLNEVVDDKERGRQLSGGERQRVLLARCLSYKPDLVLLDEGFSYLDIENGLSLLEMVLRKVPTVILMTHRNEFVGKMERVYRFVDGRLEV